VGVRAWLALLVTLPMLVVGSGAVAGTSTVVHNGLIAIQGPDGIYVVEPGSDAARLLPKSTGMSEPAWSPDGSLLAVELWDDVDSSVYTMKPDGSDRQVVLHNASAPSWSPDGKRLVVVRNTCLAPYLCADDNDGSILVTVDLDGSNPEPLGATSAHDSRDLQDASQPAWSPDGKWIAFVAAEGGIKLVSTDSKAVRTVADDGFSVSWSPDSSTLAFDRLAPGTDAQRQVVVLLDLKTGRESILPGRQAGATSPVWSPDGTLLAFVSSTPAAVQTGACGGHFDTHLWVTAPDGTESHRLIKEAVFGTPTWAPALETQAKPSDALLAPKPSDATASRTDLQPVLTRTTAKAVPRASTVRPVATRRDARPPAAGNGSIAARAPGGIYLIDPARGTVQKVPGTAAMEKPMWSPRGRLLAVEQAEGGGSTSVYTIKADGSHLQLVLKDASLLSWSADGRQLFVVRGGCAAPDGCDSVVDDSVLLSVRPDGSDARQVEAEDIDVSELGWPADGSWIAFFEDVTADDGSIPESFDSSSATLSPDGTKLAIVSSPNAADGDGVTAGDSKTGLWVIDAEWSKPRFVAKGSFQSPSWGPEPAQSD
jgi:Tol biopolymer transport system component